MRTPSRCARWRFLLRATAILRQVCEAGKGKALEFAQRELKFGRGDPDGAEGDGRVGFCCAFWVPFRLALFSE